MRQPGDAAAPPVGIELAQVNAADRDPAPLRIGEAKQERNQRRLSHAAPSGDEQPFAGLDRAVEAGENRPGPARVGEVDLLQPDRGRTRVGRGLWSRRHNHRRRQVDQLESPARGGQAVGRGMKLSRDRPQRQVQLRREHEHREGRPELDASIHQPDSDHGRDQGDRHRRGQLEHQRREEGDPESAHRLFAELLAGALDRLHLSSPAPVGTQRRQPAHHVEEVGAHQRQRAQPALRPLLRRLADQHGEERDQRKRDRHDRGRDRIAEGDPDENRRRNDCGQHELGQEAREVGIERAEPARYRRRHFARAQVAEAGGPRPKDLLERAPAQAAAHPPRGRLAARLQCPAEPGSQRGDRNQRGEQA